MFLADIPRHPSFFILTDRLAEVKINETDIGDGDSSDDGVEFDEVPQKNQSWPSWLICVITIVITIVYDTWILKETNI